jgi:hypothetical protein
MWLDGSDAAYSATNALAGSRSDSSADNRSNFYTYPDPDRNPVRRPRRVGRVRHPSPYRNADAYPERKPERIAITHPRWMWLWAMRHRVEHHDYLRRFWHCTGRKSHNHLGCRRRPDGSCCA